MANSMKEQEREELHKAIWNIANDLRGSVDGWDFKQYVLGFMFYRYISENITDYINAGEYEAGNTAFNYADISDEEAEQVRDDMVKTKGFFILPSQLFVNVRKRREKRCRPERNARKNIQSNRRLGTRYGQRRKLSRDCFDDVDVNSNKLGATVARRNEKLVKLARQHRRYEARRL